MKSLEFLTATVLASRSLDQNLNHGTVVLWADLLLAQGQDCSEVKNLICVDASSSKAQVEKLVDDCLTRLGLSLVDEKLAHLLWVWAWSQRLLKAETTADEFLENMRKLCVDFEHEPVYMQFYLLHCSRKNLSKTGAIIFHDREVNENNFEQVLRWEIDLFLEQHEETISKLIRRD